MQNKRITREVINTFVKESNDSIFMYKLLHNNMFVAEEIISMVHAGKLTEVRYDKKSDDHYFIKFYVPNNDHIIVETNGELILPKDFKPLLIMKCI